MTAVDAQALADAVRAALLEFAADSIARTAGNGGQYGRRESALAALDGLVEALGRARRLAEAVNDFCENEAPAEWDGGDLGYSVGGLDAMATDLLVALGPPVPVRGDEQ